VARSDFRASTVLGFEVLLRENLPSEAKPRWGLASDAMDDDPSHRSRKQEPPWGRRDHGTRRGLFSQVNPALSRKGEVKALSPSSTSASAAPLASASHSRPGNVTLLVNKVEVSRLLPDPDLRDLLSHAQSPPSHTVSGGSSDTSPTPGVGDAETLISQISKSDYTN